MTEIVRASLGLPTLQAGPQFQSSKRSYHLKKKSQYVWVIGYWNLRFIYNLVLGIWDFEMRIEKCEMTFEFFSTPDSWLLNSLILVLIFFLQCFHLLDFI